MLGKEHCSSFMKSDFISMLCAYFSLFKSKSSKIIEFTINLLFAELKIKLQ